MTMFGVPWATKPEQLMVSLFEISDTASSIPTTFCRNRLGILKNSCCSSFDLVGGGLGCNISTSSGWLPAVVVVVVVVDENAIQIRLWWRGRILCWWMDWIRMCRIRCDVYVMESAALIVLKRISRRKKRSVCFVFIYLYYDMICNVYTLYQNLPHTQLTWHHWRSMRTVVRRVCCGDERQERTSSHFTCSTDTRWTILNKNVR